MLSSHTELRNIDQRTRQMMGVYRDPFGKTMGSVFLPIELSPTTSWKSCTWMVVARMEAMTKMESMLVSSSREQSVAAWAIRSVSIIREFYEQAMRVPPVAKHEYPTAFIRFLLNQCWSPCNSWYIGTRRVNAALARKTVGL